MSRSDALRELAARQGLTGSFLVFNQVNIEYFTGFSGAVALLIPDMGENVLFVSGVNHEQAKAEAKGLTVELLKRGENLMEKIAKQSQAQKYGVDSLSIENWRSLAKAVGGDGKLEPVNSLIVKLRSVKDKNEIGLIREACKIGSLGMKTAYEMVQPGISEKELAAEVEFTMRKAGSDGTSFDTIIASGATSAFPHGSCSTRTIRDGDLVVVDLGATYSLYRSDMTRTYIAGKPSEKQTRMYETVKKAHQEAFEVIKAGAAAKEVDTAARKVIESAGLGEFFVHNLGHGVGLEIHEAPTLSPDSKDILASGNVVTDEPGVYLPGLGGVRIEDSVLVSQEGAEKLTVGPYDLIAKR